VVIVVVVARVSRRSVLPRLSVVGQIALPSGVVPTLAGVRPIRIRSIRRTTRLLVGSVTASVSSSPSVPARGLEEVSFVLR
jgi:hypothetical protein